MKRFVKTSAAALAFVLLLVTVRSAEAWEQKKFDIAEIQKKDEVYKIHGDNRGNEKYECNSFESPPKERQLDRSAAVLHAKLAMYAYQDSGTGYHYTAEDGTQVALKTKQALHETRYTPLDAKAVRKYIPEGTVGLHVNTDGTITGKSANGLNAVLLKGPDGEIVISYRGTNKNWRDIVDDAKQVAVAKIVPQQYKDAALLLQTVMESTREDKTPIICDGHSLGGGEVTYAMAATDLETRVKGYTYNAAGLSESTVESLDKNLVLAAAGNIVNIRNQWDAVSYVGYHLGPTYEVKTTGPYEGDNHNPKNDHSIAHLTENMIAAVGASAAPKTVPSNEGETEVNKPGGGRNAEAPSPAGVGSQQGNAQAQGNDPNGNGQEPSRYSTDLAQALADGLASLGGELFPDAVAQWLKETLEKCAEKLSDKAREALIKEACEKLPGDKSKEAFKKLLEDWDTKKDSQTLQADIEGLLKDVVRDEFEAALAKSGLGKDEAETARKVLEDVLTKDLKDIPGAVEGDLKDYVHQKIEKELGKDSADEVLKLYDTLTDPDTWTTENGWEDLGKQVGNTVEAITFDALTKIVDKQIAKWGKEHPEVKKWLDALGIDGAYVSGAAKNIWGILTGDGTWDKKFEQLGEFAATTLNNLARKAAAYGLEKLRGWVSGIAKKWCQKALDWIAGKLKEWFGFKIPQKGLELFQKAIDSLSNKAGKVFVDLGNRGIEKILGPDPSAPPKQGVPAATEAGQGNGTTLLQGPVKK